MAFHFFLSLLPLLVFVGFIVGLIARRRGDNHKLGLALHIGFLRMSGRPLNSVRAVPAVLLRNLGSVLGIETPDLASLRALYARGRTLFDHQQQACEALGFEHQRRALVRILRDEVIHSADRERLLLRARHWLYEHRLIIVHVRAIRALVAAALAELEAATAQAIHAEVPVVILKRCPSAVETTRPDGQPCQSWLWSAPAKHSTRQISEVLERIAFLTELGVDRYLGDLNDVLVRRYARRMATRPPSVSARIKEPARTVEVACFLRECLLTASDQLILMFQRRVADLWRRCHRLGRLGRAVPATPAGADRACRPTRGARRRAARAPERDHCRQACATRTQSRVVIRQRLIDAIALVRSLLVACLGRPPANTRSSTRCGKKK